MPKVSIIVPVYNSEKFLHRCINSILSQTYTDFECILLNDCSTDNSGMICDEYASKDNRIKVIYNLKNKGASLSRKTGFEFSTGEYILFIDSDDWIKPDMVLLLYQKVIKDNCDIAICNVYYIYKNGNIKLLKQDYSSNNKINILKKIFYEYFHVFLFNKLIKRELLQLIEFPPFNCSEDSVITIQLLFYAEKIDFINDYLYYYCYNEFSLTQNKERINKTLIEENKNWQIIIDFLKDKYSDLSIFEPELSIRINDIKDKYLKNKDLKNNMELFDLYPESKYYIRIFYFWKLKRMIKSFIKLFVPIFIINKLR